MNKVRCAIYTRKSSDEGLDQAFNSLDAQREACEAYIKSQKHEGWKALPTLYDDGGASGGNLARPALQQLMTDVDAGRVDMIVVYKIDRLTRSLADFAKLVDRLDAAGASFVSVTQQFNTSTSMGRLTLNVLLSFAQFEREVTAERIRDKIAASKKKGMWMGGLVPLGYVRADDGLKISRPEAATIRRLFQSYLEFGCVRKLKTFADAENLRTKRHVFQSGRVSGEVSFSRGHLYHVLSNPIYIGKIRHHDQLYDGLHDPIINQELWDQVQAKRSENSVTRATRSNTAKPSPLAGKLFDEREQRLTPSHTNKKGTRYRYYVSANDKTDRKAHEPRWRLPACELEAAVLTALCENHDIQLAMAEAGTRMPTSEQWMMLVDRVEIHPDQIAITVELPRTGQYTLQTPYTLRRRGNEYKLVLNDGQSKEPDLVMVRRILRAMKWVDRIKSGETVVAIASSEDISTDYITHNIDMAYLSPEILHAILEGRQRADLTTADLSRRRWSVDWSQQQLSFLN